MAKTFKVLSALLSYPTVDLQQAVGELRTVVETEALVPAAIRRQLDALMTDIAGGDIYDLQERYVLLFDRTRSLSLHLFEHVHGESRDRGQAMVDLLAMYEDKGLAAVKNELPDYLPLFLEFLATLPQAEACDLLGQPAHILGALAGIATRMAERGISLESIVQRARSPRADAPGQHDRAVPQPVILITYETSEQAMVEALAAMRGDGHIAEVPQFIRIEQL